MKVAEVFFSLEKKNFYAFYRKVLNNILKFWFSLNRSKYIMGEEENADPEESFVINWFWHVFINDWVFYTELLY